MTTPSSTMARMMRFQRGEVDSTPTGGTLGWWRNLSFTVVFKRHKVTGELVEVRDIRVAEKYIKYERECEEVHTALINREWRALEI